MLELYAGFTCDVRKEVSDRHTRLIHRKIFFIIILKFSVDEPNNKVADNIVI